MGTVPDGRAVQATPSSGAFSKAIPSDGFAVKVAVGAHVSKTTQAADGFAVPNKAAGSATRSNGG